MPFNGSTSILTYLWFTFDAVGCRYPFENRRFSKPVMSHGRSFVDLKLSSR